jgi:hypothetical protein
VKEPVSTCGEQELPPNRPPPYLRRRQVGDRGRTAAARSLAFDTAFWWAKGISTIWVMPLTFGSSVLRSGP